MDFWRLSFDCDVCDVKMNSRAQYEQHIKGIRHLKRAQMRQSGTPADGSDADSGGSEDGRTSGSSSSDEVSDGADWRKMSDASLLPRSSSVPDIYSGVKVVEGLEFCSLCNVSLTSPQHKEQHCSGSKHRKRLIESTNQQPLPPISDYRCLLEKGFTSDSPNHLGDRTDWHQCKICKCNLNSEQQLRIHEDSPKHKKQLDKQVLKISRPCENISKITLEEQGCSSIRKMVQKMAEMGVGGSKAWQSKTDDEKYATKCHQVDPEETIPKQVYCGDERAVSDSEEEQKKFLEPLFRLKQLENKETGALNLIKDNSGAAEKQVLSVDGGNCQELEVNLDRLNNRIFPFVSPEKDLPADKVVSGGENPGEVTDHEILNLEGEGNSESQVKNVEPEKNSKTESKQEILLHGNSDDSSVVEQEETSETTEKLGNCGNSSGRKVVNRLSTPNCSGAVEENCVTDDSIEKIIYGGICTISFCKICKKQLCGEKVVKAHLKGRLHQHNLSVQPALDRNIDPIRQDFEGDAENIAYKLTNNIPRAYQVELFIKAASGDNIIFLPTGTGKTFIAVMLISHMLKRNPIRPVLFLVDKVLLVFQQSKLIMRELNQKFIRNDLQNEGECVEREIHVASLCGGSVDAKGIPLWKNDVIVATAAFCSNLMQQKILKWQDFSMVIIDEAHHCIKSHPFNRILKDQHLTLPADNRPKILGLTASPGGQDSIKSTIELLSELLNNMGNSRIIIVEEYQDELRKIKSNANLITETLPPNNEEKMFIFILQTYLAECLFILKDVSTILHYVDLHILNSAAHDKQKKISDLAKMLNGEVLETLQLGLASSVITLDHAKNRVALQSLLSHTKKVCSALSAADEMGILFALDELQSLQNSSNQEGFQTAKELNLPYTELNKLIIKYLKFKDINLDDEDSEVTSTLRCLIHQLTNLELINWEDTDKVRPMALVLVKQRRTANKLCKILKESTLIKHHKLSIVAVVGHGGTSRDFGMTISQQKQVLDEIKGGMHQIIIATSVAEEGIDLPKCQLVVTLKPPTSVTALVQMRGRARKKGSKFLVICDSEKEKNKICLLMEKEKLMEDASKSLVKMNTHYAN